MKNWAKTNFLNKEFVWCSSELSELSGVVRTNESQNGCAGKDLKGDLVPTPCYEQGVGTSH